MIFMNTVTIDSMGREVKSSDSESRKCERTWWKLGGEERKKHVDLMRIQLLSPFLFSKVYQDEMWIEWAKSSRLLSQKRIGAMDDLSPEEFENTDLVEVAINNLQEEIDQHHHFIANNKEVQFLEELLDSIGSCKKVTNLADALDKVRKTAWFRAVRTQVEKISLRAPQDLKKDAAVFLAACQVTNYMMAVHGGDKPLITYKDDSTLDSLMEKGKNEGNKFYANAEYSKAISKYTAILYAKPYLYIVYGNRAACYLKKEEYRSALSDGRRATTLNPQWEKGQYRYAQAFYELGDKEDALKVLSKALQLCGKNVELSSYRKKIRSELSMLKRKTHFPSNDDSENEENESDKTDDDYIDDDLPDLDYETPVDDDEDDDSDSGGMPALITDSDSDTESDNGINECKKISKRKEKEKLKRKKSNDSVDKKKSNDSVDKKTTKNKPSNDNTSTQNETEKDDVKKKKKKKTKTAPPQQTIDPVIQMKLDLSSAMKEGSLALLENRGRSAIYEYSKAFHLLEGMKDDPLNIIGSMDYIVLHYANGVAHWEAGTYLDLVESIRIFGEINVKFCNKQFPLAYFGIGKVFVLQNKFKEALSPLNQALINASSVVKLNWPGVDTIIEETKPGVLKEAINALIAQCMNPPRPDAICRYTECKQSRKVMYFSDPDFKGFVRLICTACCFVEFHAGCWKRYRSHNMLRTSEKDYLDDECSTPDCVGTVQKVEIFEDGSMIAKTNLISDKQKEVKKPSIDKKKRMKPSSERGYQKKMERYKEKLKRKEQEDFGKDDVDVIDQILAVDSKNDSSKDTPEVKDDGTTPPSDLPLEGEMYVLRNKDDQDMLFQGGKSKKVKPKKTPKPKITLDIPFLERETTNHHGSFQPPEELKEQIEAFEKDWERNNNNTGFSPYIIDNSESIVDGFDFDIYKNVVMEPKKVALHIYSMFEQILEATGCGDVHNSKDILEFYNILDDSSKLLIQTVGGLRTFLTKCNRFSFDKKNRNIVYLTSQESFYHLGRDSAFKYNDTYPPPQCEDPLFVNKLDFEGLLGDATEQMNPQAQPFIPTSTDTVIDDNDVVNELNDTNSSDGTFKKELDEKPAFVENPPGTLNDKVKINSEIDQLDGCFGNVDEYISKPVEKLKPVSVSKELGRMNNTSVKEDLEAVITNKLNIGCEEKDSSFGDVSKMEIISSKEKVEHKVTEVGSFLDDETAEIVEFTKTTYPKKNSGFQLSESIDYGVIQDSRREDVNMTVFENSDNNCKVCIITEKGSQHKNLDTFKKVFGGENALEEDDKKKVRESKKSASAHKTKSHKEDFVSTEKKREVKTKPDERNEPLCVGEAGVQYGSTLQEERKLQEENNDLLRKCENLRELNIKLMNERKQMQAKEEKLQDELQKQKNRYLTSNEKLQSEVSEQKKTIEKMRKENMRTTQSNESEIKKHVSEKKELNGSLKSLQKKLDEALSQQKTLQKGLDQKDSEVTELKRTNAEIKRIRESEKRELEDIIQGLTSSQSQQSQRAQKVEIALLEVKKEMVIKKYREQAVVVQNTLNQMQFWPNIPEAQNIRSIWEEYKNHFQVTYQKMQEEFVELIRAVKDGQPLETMPPAKYADPPPYPTNAPTLNMNPHGMGLPNQPPRQEQLMPTTQRHPPGAPAPPQNHVNAQQNNRQQSQPPHEQIPPSNVGEQHLNKNGSVASNATIAAGYDSDSDESFGSSSNKSNDEPKLPIKMLDRVILRLASSFPNHTRYQLQYLVTDFRRQQGSMSGMTFEEIVFGIEHWVKTGRFLQKNQSIHASTSRQPVDVVKGKKSLKTTTANPASSFRVRASHLAAGAPSRTDHPNGSWLENPAVLPIRHDGFDQDDGCIICFEDMNEKTTLKLHCGHVFHKNCISCWLNEQRTCPICRVHALLPDEYPALETLKMPH